MYTSVKAAAINAGIAVSSFWLGVVGHREYERWRLRLEIKEECVRLRTEVRTELRTELVAMREDVAFFKKELEDFLRSHNVSFSSRSADAPKGE